MAKVIFSAKQILAGHRGAVAIVVVILMFMFLGFAAFAVDFGYSYMVKNELQNAADAAALAGASVLFSSNELCISSGSPYSCCTGSGTGSCNPSVVDSNNVVGTAQAVAAQNTSGGNQVPAPTVEIGHYAFASSRDTPGTFTATQTYQQMQNWETLPFSTLNGRTDFLNAVKATVTRTDVPRFFSRIWSSSNLAVTAQAVAYIGFAGTLEPGAVDLPIAICKQSIMLNNTYSCNRGRMINSSTNQGSETGGWTNYDQGTACNQPDPGDVPITRTSCGGGNVVPLFYGVGIGLTNGELQNTYDALMKCWVTANGGTIRSRGQNYDILTWPTQIWKVTLPVVDCSSGVSNCSKLVGAVTLNIVWMTRTGTNTYDDAPRQMGSWTCPAGSTGQQCWTSFRDYYNLKRSLADDPAIFADKTIYFQPDCAVHEPSGATGGENYGIQARYPVLVPYHEVP